MTTDQFPSGQDSADSGCGRFDRNAVNDSALEEECPVVSDARNIYGTLLDVRFDGNRAYFDLDDHGVSYTDIECYADMGQELIQHIGRFFRFGGQSSWIRTGEGKWELRSFFAGHFNLLQDRSLREEVDEICQWFQDHSSSRVAPPGLIADASDDFSKDL